MHFVTATKSLAGPDDLGQSHWFKCQGRLGQCRTWKSCECYSSCTAEGIWNKTYANFPTLSWTG